MIAPQGFRIETMAKAGQTGEPYSDPVVASIERVLKAERDGIEILRKSRSDADHLLTDARAQAAALARRADRCIAKLHTAYLQKVERDIQALAREREAYGAGAGRPYEAAALAAAARRLAAKLTGGP